MKRERSVEDRLDFLERTLSDLIEQYEEDVKDSKKDYEKYQHDNEHFALYSTYRAEYFSKKMALKNFKHLLIIAKGDY